jgi:hypothetical protein
MPGRAVLCRFVLCFPYRSIEFSGSKKTRTFYFPDPDPDRDPRIHASNLNSCSSREIPRNAKIHFANAPTRRPLARPL